MSIRTREERIVFRMPFSLAGVEDEQRPGSYLVQVEEELIESLSFHAVRRLSTTILVPVRPGYWGSTQSIAVDQRDLDDALQRDASASAVTGTGSASSAPR